MKLISLNTGLPREVMWHGRSVTTGIFKEPVHNRVALRTLNLDGDRQADLSVHGGEYKAVYCYPLAHYDYWKRELPARELPMGIFGENFTLDGLLEDSVHLGDQFSVGSAEVVVTQPRLPCYKLGVRFEADDMVKRFLASGRTGFYLAVTSEGEVGAGDEMRVSVATQTASRFRKSLACMPRKGIALPMWLGCSVPSELQPYLKVGRSTSASGWSRVRPYAEGEMAIRPSIPLQHPHGWRLRVDTK